MIFGRLDSQKLERTPIVEFGGPSVSTSAGPVRFTTLVNVPEAWIGLEDFLPGTEHRWAYHYNEVQLVLGGKAEITYTLGADPNKVFQAVAQKGDTYLIPCGTRAIFKVVSDEPYRHYWVIMPRYHYEKWQRDAVREEK